MPPTDAEPRFGLRSAAPVVWQLAWPAVLLNGIQTLNSVIDAYFIGHLERAALTAHGAALNIVFLLFSLGLTVSVASTALVSRFYGAKEPGSLREANRQCVRLAHYVGIGMGLLGVVAAYFAGRFLVPEGDARAALLFRDFLLAWAPGIVANTLVNTLAGSLRGTGDTRSPLVISGIQIGLHMILNIFLIYPEHRLNWMGQEFVVPAAGWGLTGAGAAISISAFISAALYLGWVRKSVLGPSWSAKLPDPEWAKRILNIAIPSALQAVLRVASFTVFTMFLRGTPNGGDALGALRVGIAIESVLFMPAFGFSVAAGALVGQNLGANQPQRAAKLGWMAAHMGGLLIGLLSIPLYLGAPNIAEFLTGGDKPGMAAEAASYIRILIVTEILFGYAMVLIGALQGAGDTKRAMWISIWSLWLVRVPLAYVLAVPMGLGATGCWIALSASQAVQGLLAMSAFKQGKWMLTKV